jgi:hypothetical protein
MDILAPMLPRGRTWIENRSHARALERGFAELFLFLTTKSTTPEKLSNNFWGSASHSIFICSKAEDL